MYKTKNQSIVKYILSFFFRLNWKIPQKLPLWTSKARPFYMELISILSWTQLNSLHIMKMSWYCCEDGSVPWFSLSLSSGRTGIKNFKVCMEWVCNAAKHSVICPSLRVFMVCYSQIKWSVTLKITLMNWLLEYWACQSFQECNNELVMEY